MSKKLRIGFLASHRGSNMQAVIDACKKGDIFADPVVVISNNKDSQALERARIEGITALHLSATVCGGAENLDQEIVNALVADKVELVVLAGYMKKIGPRVLKAFKGRIINIHPALLPKYGGEGMFGEHVHRAVLAAKDSESGATVHIVTDEYDQGPILAQNRVAVDPGETLESLSKKVLAVEHPLLVETISKIARGEIKLAS